MPEMTDEVERLQRELVYQKENNFNNVLAYSEEAKTLRVQVERLTAELVRLRDVVCPEDVESINAALAKPEKEKGDGG